MERYLNSKWETFRYSLEIGTSAATLIGTWIWSSATAAAERGYHSLGSEFLLAIGAAALVGIVSHKIMNKVEVRLNERIAEETKKDEAIRRACRARIYTIEAERKRGSGCHMFQVGE